MSDNVVITAGSGTAIATDQLAGLEHVQFVKLMDGTLDSGSKIAGDAAGGLWVNVKNASLPVTGTFWPGTQPVSGTFWQATQPVSGPLTDAQLRAAALPVSGTFWQATQPVSGPLTDAQLRASAVPVSGSFFQATQPVSGTVTANAGIGPFPVSDNGGSLTVDGSVNVGNWPGTQPVSIATNTPDVIDRAARQLGHVTVDAAPASVQSGTWTVQPGNTPNTTPWLVRDAPDTGRANVSLYAEAVAGTITEALLTLSQSKGFAAPSSGTGYTVAAGKTLRILGIFVTWVATTTTANTTRIRLRVNTVGAVATSSPIVYTGRLSWESATFIANEAEMQPLMFPGGIDVPAGASVGVSHVEAAANGTLDIQIVAFEF